MLKLDRNRNYTNSNLKKKKNFNDTRYGNINGDYFFRVLCLYIYIYQHSVKYEGKKKLELTSED